MKSNYLFIRQYHTAIICDAPQFSICVFRPPILLGTLILTGSSGTFNCIAYLPSAVVQLRSPPSPLSGPPDRTLARLSLESGRVRQVANTWLGK